MNAARIWTQLGILATLVGLGSVTWAQTVVWRGMGTTQYTDDANNWQGRTLPLNDGTEHFVFGPAARYQLLFGTDINAQKLSIAGNVRTYVVDDDYGILNLGAGGLVYSPVGDIESFLGPYGLNLTVDQTWDIQGGVLGIYYGIEGPGRMTKTGAGTLVVPYSFGWTGGITLNQGRLAFEGGTTTFSTGDLIIGPPTANPALTPTLVAMDTNGFAAEVPNNLQLNGVLRAENEVELKLTGVATLNTDTTVSSNGAALFLNGSVVDGPAATPAPRKLTIDTAGVVVLSAGVLAPNTYSGGTHVANGPLVFANGYSVPDTGLISVAATGYVGYGDSGGNEVSEFLAKLDGPNIHGAFGFDTDPSLYTPNTFFTPIDLTGFAPDARLGSVTQAILGSAAVITPQANDYRFGGGGGVLGVDSPLVDGAQPRNVVADSPARHPLTVYLRSPTNSFTGSVSATHSAVIFYAGSLPAGTGNFVLNTGGYIGTSATFTPDSAGDAAVASYLAHFPGSTHTGVVGFDSQWGTLGNFISNPINLSNLAAGTYLGTATTGYTGDGIGEGVRLSGAITPAGPAGSPYLFAGYKGGLLQVDSTLAGTGGMIIGDPTSPATFGDWLEQEYSTVYLTGNNSGLSGNVQLYGGRLIVGQTNGFPGVDATAALGTGALVVQPFPWPSTFTLPDGDLPYPLLAVDPYDAIISNPVQLNTRLGIGFEDGFTSSVFTLTGQVTGPGSLYLTAHSDVRLANDANNFLGGVYVSSGGTLRLATNNALGPGPLGFGYSGGTVYFATGAPVVNGLFSGEQDFSSLKLTANDTILTINQATDGLFTGDVRPDIVGNPTHNDSIRFVKSGAGSLRLFQGGLYYYNAPAENSLAGAPPVSLQVNQGTLEIGRNFYIEGSASTIWVHGGTLALEAGGYILYNPMVIDNGGRLAGTGLVDTVSIGSGAILSPGGVGGFSLGSLAFYSLTLASGGTYEWNLVDASMTGGAWDIVSTGIESGVDIAATSGAPFTIKLSTVGYTGAAALAANFDPTQSYSWMLIDSLYLTNFSPSKFTIDASGFMNSLSGGPAGNGYFWLSLGGTNSNSLLLNFTPVPEPSTWALLLLGLGLAPLAARRRRQG